MSILLWTYYQSTVVLVFFCQPESRNLVSNVWQMAAQFQNLVSNVCGIYIRPLLMQAATFSATPFTLSALEGLCPLSSAPLSHAGAAYLASPTPRRWGWCLSALVHWYVRFSL